MKIKVWVSTGISGAGKSVIVDLPDDGTEEQIDRWAEEEMHNMIEWGYDILEDEED